MKKKDSNKSVVISGANGFLGTLAAQKFFNEGYDVYSLIFKNDLKNYELLSNISKTIIVTDYCDNFLKDVPYNFDCFLHFAWAGVNGKSKGDEFVQKNNIDLAEKCFLSSCKKRCKKFIGIGTVTEFSFLESDPSNITPSFIYGKYKYECYKKLENLSLKFKGTDFLWARLTNLYGITNSTGNILDYELKAFINKQIPEFGPCNQFYDFLDVNDAIDVLFELSKKKLTLNNIFIGSGDPHLLKTYLKYVCKIYGNNTHIIFNKNRFDGLVFKKEFFNISCLKKALPDFKARKFKTNIKILVNKMLTGIEN